MCGIIKPRKETENRDGQQNAVCILIFKDFLNQGRKEADCWNGVGSSNFDYILFKGPEKFGRNLKQRVSK